MKHRKSIRGRVSLTAPFSGVRAVAGRGGAVLTASRGTTNDENETGGGLREASWSAPVLWRFGLRTGCKSGRGLPQSKALRAHTPNRHFLLRLLCDTFS